jgi:hypothetical protein
MEYSALHVQWVPRKEQAMKTPAFLVVQIPTRAHPDKWHAPHAMRFLQAAACFLLELAKRGITPLMATAFHALLALLVNSKGLVTTNNALHALPIPMLPQPVRRHALNAMSMQQVAVSTTCRGSAKRVTSHPAAMENLAQNAHWARRSQQ